MGSFGSSKKANTANNNALAALTPPDLYTPFGRLVGNQYTPIESADAVTARNTADQKINTLINNIPTRTSVSDLFDNPYYQSTLDLYQTPLNQQKQQDLTSLNNSLSARNQLGSSFEAYQRNLLSQRYDNLYGQARDHARSASLGAYNNSIQNLLTTLGTLRNERNASVNAAMMPLGSALDYQRVQEPYRMAQASYWLQQQNINTGSGNGTGLGKIGGAVSGALRGAAMGSGFGPAGMIGGAALGGTSGYFAS